MTRPRLNVTVYGQWTARIIKAGPEQSEIEWVKADPILNGKRAFVPNSAIGGAAWARYSAEFAQSASKKKPIGTNRAPMGTKSNDRPRIALSRPRIEQGRLWTPSRTPELD